MCLCIGIREDQLREVVSLIDVNKYKFKFLYNSENHEEFHNELGIQTLRDNVIFSGCTHYLKKSKIKVAGSESSTNINLLLENIFEDERQISIVNDFYEHQYLVLVFTNKYKDPAEKKGNDIHSTLTTDNLNDIIYKFLRKLEAYEGIPTTTWDLYKSGAVKESEGIGMNKFLEKQKSVRQENIQKYQIQLLRHFEESFKFRLITIYTKLRDYGLNDIMRKLDELGYLDDRFKNDIYVYEEEARRLLAKRLCVLSFKNDIEVLVNKGVYSSDKINYTI